MSSESKHVLKTRDLDDPPSPSTSLLLSFDSVSSNSSSSSLPQKPAIIFISLVLITCLALSSATAFVFLFFSSSQQTPRALARPLRTLHRPTVILISFDGFRFGYQHKTHLPNINRLISNGTEADRGLIPVFPTLTFPNHYSIVTGLFPSSHGIINNHFVDPHDGDSFNMGSHEPKWWLGEPLWETVVNRGLKASTFFWPGSEVKKGSWDCPKGFCMFYNESVSFDVRVETVLSYFDLPGDEIPSFMTLYFEDPDHQGHQFGPDDPEINSALERLDVLLGKLIGGLEKRGVFEDVNLVLLGDHGMVGTCDGKLVFLDDLSPWIEIDPDWVHSTTPLLAMRPTSGVDPSAVVEKINEGLGSGRVKNGARLKVFLKGDLPSRLHYSESDRIPPIIGMVEEGYKVEMKRNEQKECGGAHGYDNAVFSMRTIFVGHGPRFARGRKVPSFENVEVYNLVTAILGIEGAPNNGSRGFPESVLLDG